MVKEASCITDPICGTMAKRLGKSIFFSSLRDLGDALPKSFVCSSLSGSGLLDSFSAVKSADVGRKMGSASLGVI